MIATLPYTYNRAALPARTAVPALVPVAPLALEHLSLAHIESSLALGLALLLARGLATASDVKLLAELAI